MIIDSKNLPPRLAGSTLKALCHLAEVGEAKARDIAEAVGFTRGAATGLLDYAEKDGLIARSRRSDDRRLIIVSLTPEGRELVESWRPQPEPVEAPELEEAVA